MTAGESVHRIRIVQGPVSTDDIIPGRYKHMYTDPKQLAPHVFENLLPGFAASLAPGDAIYCRETFGIGSSREQAVSSLLAAGVTVVLAPSFGRIFFRNAWNLGLLVLEVDALPVTEGARIKIDLLAGQIVTPSALTWFQPPPREMLAMRDDGGLLAQIEKRVNAGPPKHSPTQRGT
jgi:3-isopropylmalate/(R)-2-methylmalate dehydratase small subunit